MRRDESSKAADQPFLVLLDDRRPGCSLIAHALQQQHPQWSWKRCCAAAKEQWHVAQSKTPNVL